MKDPNAQPPRFFLRFFRWFCHPKMQDYIEGDLMEVYEKRLKKSGKQIADIRFAIDVILLFRPGIIRPSQGYQHLNTIDMYSSYLKSAWRNLTRNKGYSALNIGGLAIGISVAILIGLWINDEMSFNHYYENYNSIGQLWAGDTNPETSAIEGSVSVQFPAASVLKNNYGQYFKSVLLAWWITDNTLSIGDKKFVYKGEFIEDGVIEMFSLKMIKGSTNSLKDPHSIILSKSAAKSIFRDQDPINQTLKIDNRMEVQVTGIFEDIPRNNHFSDVSFFSPWQLWVDVNPWIKYSEDNWDNRSFNIYVQLQPNVTLNDVNAGVHGFYVKNSPEKFLSEFQKYKSFAQVYPMNQWHLYSEFINGKPQSGRIQFVWLFGAVGVFVLILACINFINLSTARSEKRAKETGIRKAIGSAKNQLVGQFLTESFFVVIISLFVAILIVSLSLPFFNNLADKDILIPFFDPIFCIAIVSILLVTGIMAGLYPAFYLSSFQPVKVLKGVARSGRQAGLPRKILVTIQFTVSVVLIVGTIVVYQQIEYTRDRPTGYSRENLISIRMMDPSFSGKFETVRNELLETELVDEVAYADNPLTMAWNNYAGYSWEGKDPNVDSDFTVCYVSNTYGSAVNWQVVEGRDFNKLLASDSASIIINESAVKYMGLKNPVDKYMTDGYGNRLRIIGVVRDLIMNSPYEPVKQTIFTWSRYGASNIIVRIKDSESVAETVAMIESIFKKIIPSAGFDYRFVDDEYEKKFSQEQRIGNLSKVFASLAILISCLGLFGLSSYVAEQRTKEIGIRKILGASVGNLLGMQLKDFFILVIISNLISFPIAHYIMTNWLNKYQYHMEISTWIYVATGAVVIAISLLTVGFHSVRAALLNPVNSLRSE